MTTTHAQISWMPWGPAAFDRARHENKLILVDSGATWCHWCHVMDRVTYEDPEAAAVIEELFVAVRIDRDRQSEVDAYLQRSQPLAGAGGAGGWPLTVVLTPEGGVLFKGTFLPPRPDPDYGAGIGLIDVLRRLDEYWRGHREQVHEAAEKARQHVVEGYDRLFRQPGNLSAKLVAQVVEGVKSSYEPATGGFSTAPKFFSSSALELLLSQAWRGDGESREMLVNTLDHIARGGVYDHIGGGFHRYSVDERWHVPHFEKMAYDNAAMLALYANAYALTGIEEFARVARHTMGFISQVLTDPESGAFFASQDADVGLDDDGDYFTWSLEEFRSAVGPHARWLEGYFDLDAAGDMHDRPGRNVLHTPRTPAQQAQLQGIDEPTFRRELLEGMMLLMQARRQRRAPAVDTTVFADLNGMLIDAHLAASDRLRDSRACSCAMRALEALMATHRDSAGVFAHFVRDGELQSVGLLSDQAWMGKALTHAYAVSGRRVYLRAARQVGDHLVQRLVADDGAFLSAPEVAGDAAVHPLPMRSWEDSPVRSVGSVAAEFLTDLGYLSGEARYTWAARRALESLAGGVDRDMGMFLAGYAFAVEHLLMGPVSITVVGELDPRRCREVGGFKTDAGELESSAAEHDAAHDLAVLALERYVPHAMVMLLDVRRDEDSRLLEQLHYPHTSEPTAFVCQGAQCMEPARTAEEFHQRIERLKAG